MKQQTAVEWLQAEFNKWAEGRVFIPQNILEQAKAMEKEQINKACYDGYYQEEWYDVSNYYDETYNK